MRGVVPLFRLALLCVLPEVSFSTDAQPAPVLTWVTNSSVKLEQVIGDIDWQWHAVGSNVPTASQTVTRFHILANGLGYSFEDNGKLIFLFGDTISESNSIWNYHAADPLAWSTNTDGEAPLVLNFFTNRPSPITNSHGLATNNFPVFVQAVGNRHGAGRRAQCRHHPVERGFSGVQHGLRREQHQHRPADQ